MNPTSIHAALIDLDGTLLDTAPDLASAINAMLTGLGQAPLSLDRITGFIGQGAEQLVQQALTNDPQGQAPADLLAQGLTRFKQHYHVCNGAQAQAYPNVQTGLEAMLDAGLRLACVTNKPREFTIPLLQSSGLAR